MWCRNIIVNTIPIPVLGFSLVAGPFISKGLGFKSPGSACPLLASPCAHTVPAYPYTLAASSSMVLHSFPACLLPGLATHSLLSTSDGLFKRGQGHTGSS
jgi:hypothetical protein